LKQLEEMKVNGDFFRRPKKEQATLNRELTKLDKSLGGLKNMRGRPDVLFIIDNRKEHIAFREARKTGTTVIGIIDTNCDPDGIDYLIPGNDDSTRSIQLICGTIADAILHEGPPDTREGGGFDDDPGSGPDVHPVGIPRVPYPTLSGREIALELEEQYEEEEG
jgi:ribosomal protein S2, bacterial type